VQGTPFQLDGIEAPKPEFAGARWTLKVSQCPDRAYRARITITDAALAIAYGRLLRHLRAGFALNVTWSGYLADHVVAAEASLYSG
jgi:hypothetical protein